MATDRDHWDSRYRQRERQPLPAPDALLVQFTPPHGGRALDLASGLGQNGLWLAAQGYQVDWMDISQTGLDRTRAEAAARFRRPQPVSGRSGRGAS